MKKSEVDDYKKGDFYPSQIAPIVLKEEVNKLKFAKWGFPFYGNKRLVINDRAESIMDKPMFKNSFYSARCITPVNLFYEWKDEGSRKKVKHGIYLKDKNIMSLGGIFKLTSDEKGNRELSFVIITTEANRYMKDIHSRMLLIIDDGTLDYWLDKGTPINIIEEIFKSNGNHELETKRENNDEPFQQLKLF
ncbi:SOS response-associated peptidase [Tepidimicrobium xylanilyticum]|nr:SOS response-associated peptidase family protein [Tepidimicrobium xylanilyticum]